MDRSINNYRRARVMVNGALAEDVLDYNRFHEQMQSMMPDHVRDNIDNEGFGYRWDDKQNKFTDNNSWSETTMPGIEGGKKQTVAFKPCLGLLNQSKFLAVKYAPIVIELEVVNNNLDAIITPGVINRPGAAAAVFTAANTGTD